MNIEELFKLNSDKYFYINKSENIYGIFKIKEIINNKITAYSDFIIMYQIRICHKDPIHNFINITENISLATEEQITKVLSKF